MPIGGVKLTSNDNLPNLEERKRMIKVFYDLGVNKIRFTGGEPTVSNQLLPLVEFCRSMPNIKTIGMTSNGIKLNSVVDDLVAAGLTHVNISLDTLDKIKFASITRRDEKFFLRVLSSIYQALSKGLKVQVNCVLIRGVNDDEIKQFVELCRDVPLDIRVIELMVSLVFYMNFYCVYSIYYVTVSED